MLPMCALAFLRVRFMALAVFKFCGLPHAVPSSTRLAGDFAGAGAGAGDAVAEAGGAQGVAQGVAEGAAQGAAVARAGATQKGRDWTPVRGGEGR